MNFLATNVGLAAATVAAGGPKINISSFRLGTSTTPPDPGDTALHGATVYTGSVSAVLPVDADTADIIVQVPANAGPFLFGEIGIYTDTGVLFARAAYATQQEKIYDPSNNVGSVWTVHCLIKLQSVTAVLNFTTTISTAVPLVNGNAVVSPDLFGPDVNMVLAQVKMPQTQGGTSLASVTLKRESSTRWTPDEFFYRATYTASSAANATTAVSTSGTLWTDPIYAGRTNYFFIQNAATGQVVTATSNGNGTATLSYSCSWMVSGVQFLVYEFRGDDYDTNIPIIPISSVSKPSLMGFNTNLIMVSARTPDYISTNDGRITLRRHSDSVWHPEGWTYAGTVTAGAGSSNTVLAHAMFTYGTASAANMWLVESQEGYCSTGTSNGAGNLVLNTPITTLDDGVSVRVYKFSATSNTIDAAVPMISDASKVGTPDESGVNVNLVVANEYQPTIASGGSIALVRKYATGRWGVPGYVYLGNIVVTAKSGTTITSSRFASVGDMGHTNPAFRYLIMHPTTGDIVTLASVDTATSTAVLQRDVSWITPGGSFIAWDGDLTGTEAVLKGDCVVTGSLSLQESGYTGSSFEKVAVRKHPQQTVSGAFTIGAAQVGKQVNVNATVTVPNAVFDPGEYVYIRNITGSYVNVVAGASVTLLNNFNNTISGTIGIPPYSEAKLTCASTNGTTSSVFLLDGASMIRNSFDNLKSTVDAIPSIYAPLNSPVFSGDPHVPTAALVTGSLSAVNVALLMAYVTSYMSAESLGSVSGYKFIGAFLIQWTHVTISGPTYSTGNWLIRFPNACFGAVASPNFTPLPNTPPSVYNITQDNFRVDCSSGSDAPYTFIIGIGK